MSLFNMPDWLRMCVLGSCLPHLALPKLTHHSLLVVLTCTSFVPQLYLLVIRHGNVSGISLNYVFLNLVVATELFAMSFLFTVNLVQRSDLFVHNPPNAGDWINMANFAVIWVLWLVM